jgi:outer membrane protein assembly factor BamB
LSPLGEGNFSKKSLPSPKIKFKEKEKKMTTARNKTTATVITLFLVLTIAVTLVALPIANAHYPAWLDRPTHCYVAVSPTIIGVNQAMIIVFWLDWIPPTVTGALGDRWKIYVDVTAPDGTNETLGPFTSDPVGSGYTYYTPTQIGTYTVVSRFPGQTLTGIPGRETNVNVNDTFAPSTSKPAYFTVQQEPIPRYVETPLPTGYWTRPIYDTNRGWGDAVMGQWLGGAEYDRLRREGFQYMTAPESSHILWTSSEWSGGVMGGQTGDISYYTGSAYEGFSSPMLVLSGRAYYSVQTPPRYGWYCIDLYTGETIYYENNTDGHSAMPEFGEILNYASPNQYGGFPYLWRTSGVTVPSGSTSTTTWEMLDGFSGNAICKIANVSTSGTQFRDEIGSICSVNIVNLGTTANPNYYMQIWNTTEAIWWQPSFGVFPPKTLLNGTTNIPLTDTGNSYWTWRPERLRLYDGRNGYSMNVSVSSILGPRNSVLNQTGSILTVKPDEYVVVGTGGRNDARGVVQGEIKAYSLQPNKWGQVLWDTTFTPPRATDDYLNSTYSGDNGGPLLVSVSPEDGVFGFREQYTGKYWMYSLETGQQLWTAQAYSQFYYYARTATSMSIVGGRMYTTSNVYHGRGEELAVYNATTGQLLWNWTAPSVGYLETPYTYSPLYLAFFINDTLTGREKVYLYSTEGAGLNSPIRRDAAIWCLDAETGELIWRITCWPAYANSKLALPVISDGRILVLDNHDNQLYCFGKGPSATTVSASPEVSVHGSSVLIKGTVTDQSPSGRHNEAGSLDFTLKGTPAIADESMDAWMEYMFHQRPMPTNAAGVEVSLDTVDPNGNFVHIGTVTSDITGTFGYAFTPEVPGTYQIIATFAGSKSYGASFAQTYITVDEAPPATAPPEYPQPIDSTMTIVYATIAIIIAMVLIGIWIKRK